MSAAINPAPDEPFLAGEFLVIPERNELRRLDATTGQPSTEPKGLTSKQMGVLLVLAAKPGQPASKNELFEAVWPGVVVGEDNITSCIYELRQAFGDPAYIKTVRQRGYLLSPSVVRPLPPNLLAALEPQRPDSAEILLSQVVPAALPAEKPRSLDRQGRRLLGVLLGVLALLAGAGGLFLYLRGGFTVGLESCQNLTGQPHFEQLTDSLGERLHDHFKNENPNTYYRVWRLGFFSSTTVSCEVGVLQEGWLQLRAEISPEPGGEAVEVVAEGPTETFNGLTKQLVEKVSRVLDTRACRMDTEPNLLKARHCYSAGARQLKNRSYDDARKLLTRAEDFYTRMLAEDDRHKAAEGLLLTYDQLANLFDIQGDRVSAREKIKKAKELLGNDSLGLDRNSAGGLRIARRDAQIENDIPTERGYLESLREREPGEPDWRHALGWFVFTHERDCKYAEKEFAVALSDKEMDPAIRATYYSYQGDIQLACGKPAEAIASYEQHVMLARDHGDPYDMRGNAFVMVGRYGEAQQDFQTALEHDETLVSAIINKGHLERDQGYFQDAEWEYKTFFDRAGSWPNQRRDYLIAIGRLALLKGKPEEALAAADDALKLEGGNRSQAYWLRGLAALDLGRLADAREALGHLEGLFEVSKSRFLREYLHHLRAQIALAEGHGDDALKELEEALDNHPADQLFFLGARAEALRVLGRDQEALAAYRKLLEVNPYHPRSLCAAAELALRLSSPQDAGTLYADALKNLGQRSDDPVCRDCYQRGRAYLKDSPETSDEQ